MSDDINEIPESYRGHKNMNNLQKQNDKVELMLSVMEDWFNSKPIKPFIPGETYIKVAQINQNLEDYLFMLRALIDDHWNEGGKWTEEAQELLSEITRQDYISFVNSGSSANLVAFLTLNEKFETDKIITTAVGFPTTITAPLQAGKEIVFVDTNPETLEPDYDQLKEAYFTGSENRYGVILAHTLGFPFDEEEVILRITERECWFLFDCCDALGAVTHEYPVGTQADLSTYSFYPAHHVSAIEGGAVCSRNKELTRIVESYRNWGRDCYCSPNEDNTCGARFNQKWGQMPKGYDHKYISARLGYNLKMTEIQASLLYSQLQHVQEIQESRLNHFKYMKGLLADLSDYFQFVSYDPAISTPSPFGFPILCREGISRLKLIRYLEDKKVGTRLIFGSDLSKQPAFIPYVRSGQIQCPFPLTGADNITDNAFWISCNQNLTSEQITYMVEILHQAVKEIK
jgi:Predicted pyridoxal phosphate-dependent enzyme apparently involved in regulation of cell wall biogenesis